MLDAIASNLIDIVPWQPGLGSAENSDFKLDPSTPPFHIRHFLMQNDSLLCHYFCYISNSFILVFVFPLLSLMD